VRPGLGLAAVLALAVTVGGGSARAASLAIATAGVTGVYYQFGAAVCRLLRDHPPPTPVACTTEGSEGSIRNLIDLRSGKVTMATVQGDSLYLAVRGEGPFAGGGPHRQVRSLFSFATETLNVLTRGPEQLTGMAALRGRRLAIGAPASGTAVTFRRLMADRGWTDGDFRALDDYRSTLQSLALCRGDTDGIVFVGANPSGVVQDATFTCDARLVPIEPDFVRSLLARYPFHVPAVIPGGLYPNNPDPVPTIGIRAMLVASVDTPIDTVYAVTRAVLDHLDELRTLHLAFRDIRVEEIARHCVFAPLHAGAERYFRERGIPLEACPPPPLAPAATPLRAASRAR
jgi:hypothetical protein